MANEKNKTTGNQCSSTSKPLFTGDGMRDSAVTEYEKAVEVSQVIFKAVVKFFC